jgi:hypothetical protein
MIEAININIQLNATSRSEEEEEKKACDENVRIFLLISTGIACPQ